MSYAGERRILDADSHLMELPDFLSAHADPDIRDRLPSVVDIGALAAIEGIDVGGQGERRAHPPEVVEQLVARGDALLRGPKWYGALGSFNGEERGRALDLLGFERQLIFSSITAAALFGVEDLEVACGGLRAHNRAMAEFCSADPRLVGVAGVVLDDVPRALEEIDAAIELGLGSGCRRVRPVDARRGTRTTTRSGRGSRSRACRSSCTSAAHPSRSRPSG